MTEKPYHHGNLRNALIEAGIQVLSETGPEHFSLRQVAARCGVSHAASYSHFPDKDALLEAMKTSVSDQLASALETALRDSDHAPQDALLSLGVAYVRFFREHPHSYDFAFGRAVIQIDLDHLHTVSDFRPFEIFKSAALSTFSAQKIPEQQQFYKILGMWALVHGLAGIAVMPGTRYSGDWEQTARNVMKSAFCWTQKEGKDETHDRHLF